MKSLLTKIVIGVLLTSATSTALARGKEFLGPPQPADEEIIVHDVFASLSNGCDIEVVSHNRISAAGVTQKRFAVSSEVTVKQDVNIVCNQGIIQASAALYNTQDNEVQLEFDPLAGTILAQGQYSNVKTLSLINGCELKQKYVITSVPAGNGAALLHQETVLSCINDIGISFDRLLYRSTTATSWD